MGGRHEDPDHQGKRLAVVSASVILLALVAIAITFVVRRGNPLTHLTGQIVLLLTAAVVVLLGFRLLRLYRAWRLWRSDQR